MFPNQMNMAGNQFEATVVIQTSDLRASVYPDVIIPIYYAFVYPLSPYVIASGGIHSHLSSDSLEDSQRTHIFSEIPQVFMENDKSDAHSV